MQQQRDVTVVHYDVATDCKWMGSGNAVRDVSPRGGHRERERQRERESESRKRVSLVAPDHGIKVLHAMQLIQRAIHHSEQTYPRFSIRMFLSTREVMVMMMMMMITFNLGPFKLETKSKHADA